MTRPPTPPRPHLPGDERRHLPGDDFWWRESWDFDFATPDATLGGYVHLALLPNQQVCWYWAALVGAGRDLVTVVDHEVRPPPLPGLEIRSEGLWADHIVEDAFDHVSVGCEAFALRLDDPADALAVPLLGERIPFGLDLGWETDGPLVPADGGYALPCRVVGEVLVGDERIELDAFGWRRHSWGAEPEWAGSQAGGRLRRSIRGRWADGTWLNDIVDGAGHLPSLGYRVDPVAEAPILLTAPDGRAYQLARTLCRLSDLAANGVGSTWSDQTEPV